MSQFKNWKFFNEQFNYFSNRKKSNEKKTKVLTFVLNDNCNNNLYQQQFIRLAMIFLKVFRSDFSREEPEVKDKKLY